MVSFSISRIKGLLVKKQEVIKEVTMVTYDYVLYDSISKINGSGKYLSRNSEQNLESRIKKELLAHWPDARNITVTIREINKEQHLVEV